LQSGDEATKKLREQLAAITEEFEQFKAKSKKDFEEM